MRFVVAPDGQVVPDVAAKLPGRGIWVRRNERRAGQRQWRRSLFSRAAKANVKAADADLASARRKRRCVARMLGDLGMARRSGAAGLMGFDNVLRGWQAEARPAACIEASDGAADGKRKLYGACPCARTEDRR